MSPQTNHFHLSPKAQASLWPGEQASREAQCFVLLSSRPSSVPGLASISDLLPTFAEEWAGMSCGLCESQQGLSEADSSEPPKTNREVASRHMSAIL